MQLSYRNGRRDFHSLLDAPSIVLREYEVYNWHIVLMPYQKIQLVVQVLQTYRTDMTYITVHDGPSKFAKELCLFEGYVYSIQKTLVKTTRTFQTFVSLTTERGREHFHYKMQYFKLGDWLNVTDTFIDTGRMAEIEFPSDGCPLSEPVTFCQWNIATSNDSYLVTKIEELLHTAPVNEDCHYFGVSIINFPQHLIHLWAGRHHFSELLSSSYSEMYQEVYNRYSVCDVAWIDTLPQDADHGRSIFSTSHKVLITIYIYTPFLKSLPSIRLNIQTTKQQNVPLSVPGLRISSVGPYSVVLFTKLDKLPADQEDTHWLQSDNQNFIKCNFNGKMISSHRLKNSKNEQCTYLKGSLIYKLMSALTTKKIL